MTAKLLSLRGVIEKTSLSKTVIYRLIREGSFPKQLRISVGRVAWHDEAVSRWVESISNV